MKKVASFLFLALCLLILSPLSFAQTATSSTSSIRQEKRQERMELVQAKRSAQVIKVCQTHEKNIQKRLTSLTNLVDNMIIKFDAITTRVKNHYTIKLVPAGKTISNYDALVADINTKKAAVTTALNKANSDVAGFSCTSVSDPKTDLTTYKKDMQTVKSALQDFRKSIRNLIVAVAKANGEKLEESPEPSGSPETTK